VPHEFSAIMGDIAPLTPSPTFTASGLDGSANDHWDGAFNYWAGLMSDFPTFIIELLRGCPHGLTSKEIARLLGTSPVNLSSRLSKLAAYGIIGQVRGTRAVHGTNAAIYRAPTQPPADA
jgi:CRP-like cAMP-binding protein